MSEVTVRYPANYAPGVALAYAGPAGEARTVASDNPLPVMFAAGARPPALAGQIAASGLVGPFAPAAGVPVMLQLTGDWAGTVTLQRSADGGQTRVGVTAGGAPWGVFSGNACEAVWEEAEPGATLFLDVALTGGTLAYRMAQ